MEKPEPYDYYCGENSDKDSDPLDIEQKCLDNILTLLLMMITNV